MKTYRLAYCIAIFAFSLFSCQSTQQLAQQDTQTIHQLLDDWHHAAATANEETFFGSMKPQGIYIGTDATEYWTATELKTWSKTYFERDTAWAFTPHDRHVYFSENGKTVWFDELLDTWMGTCRGSGVLQKIKGEWKLAHYHLAIAVPNDVVNEYLELIGK